MSGSKPGFIDYSWLVLLAMIWGSSFLFIKIAVVTLPPATLTIFRLVVASLVLLPVALWAREAMPTGAGNWILIALVALFGTALPFTLISWGEQRIDAGLAAILMGGMPLFTLVLAHYFSDGEAMTGAKLIGVLFGFAGLLILVGPDRLATMGEETVRELAVAGAAVCYAINAVLTKRLLGLPRLSLAAAIMVVSVVIMIPICLFLEQPLVLSLQDISVQKTAMGSAVLLGLLHTAIATLILMMLIARQGAVFFGQINLLVPLFGVAWGVAFLAERPSSNHLVALVLILSGVVISRGVAGLRKGGRQPD